MDKNIITSLLGLMPPSLLDNGGANQNNKQPVRMLWNSSRLGAYRRSEHGELLIDGKPRKEFQ